VQNTKPVPLGDVSILLLWAVEGCWNYSRETRDALRESSHHCTVLPKPDALLSRLAQIAVTACLNHFIVDASTWMHHPDEIFLSLAHKKLATIVTCIASIDHIRLAETLVRQLAEL
jgi:hypothetical protein